MSLPDIDFKSIRTVDGARDAGFEELCCQLASLEPVSSEDRFHRKGRGGDAGVECYCRRADGTEVGWQAKYLFQWTDNLRTQLDKSIRTAMNRHPALAEYVVCLPFDLPDSRSGRVKTAHEKWNAWCTKWKQCAAKQQRNLRITLWGKSELTARLTRDDPACSGRVLYWFDREPLTRAWLRDHFDRSCAYLSSRYIPEMNVELPIREDLLAFARSPEIQKQIDNWCIHVTDRGHRAVDAIRALGTPTSRSQYRDLAEAIRTLTALLDTVPVGPEQRYLLEDWQSAVSDCLRLADEALCWSYDLPPSKPGPSGIDRESWVRRNLQEFSEILHDIQSALASDRWLLTNAKAVLIKGPGGIGKSHLLADLVEHQVRQGRPALLLLGALFVDGEPWPQIRDYLDRPPTEQFKHFLGSLDAAAQVAGVRAIVCIDALNERNGVNVWPQHLAAFLQTLEAFPRIGTVLSCRSTYVPYVVPDSLDDERLFRIEHSGFGADGGAAADSYMDRRGMVRPGTPNLLPEFQNPLFLKTCCDALEKQGETQFPKGLRGLTSIFDFYHKAIAESLDRRMTLDPNLEIVQTAIIEFVRLLTDASKGHVLKAEAIDRFEAVLSSDGRLDRSLLCQLESEGVLTVEPLPQYDGSVREMVRFTFERFSDHLVAAHLLDEHLDVNDVIGSFEVDRPLGMLLCGPGTHQRAGIIEAVSIQLPERTGVEVLDVVAGRSSVVRSGFLGSLLWREQAYFSDRTLELVRDLVDADKLSDLLVSLSTEPSNKFNAQFLHGQLIELSMSERDLRWSVYLANRGFEKPVETLISWALQDGFGPIDDERAYLSATILTWFLSTSHREIRDKATKALACVLAGRLKLAKRILRDFATVNDLYVLERLLAACYGAALQGKDETALGDLASVVIETVFSGGDPPANMLLRDHARNLVEYAAGRDVLPDVVDLSVARPPYQSAWPIEPVPDDVMEHYTEDRGHATVQDAIMASCSEHGDFGRYVVKHTVENWSPAALGTGRLPTPMDMYAAWMREFLANATPAQRRALEEYVNTMMSAAREQTRSAAAEQAEAAEMSLRATMNSDEWEDFRVRAKRIVGSALDAEYLVGQTAHFDVDWARRWVCKRAHELGWTSERFGDFDGRVGGWHPYDHRVERIGKKYQWLALHELTARMADNLAFLGNQWVENDEEPTRYPEGREIDIREIDPSFLTTRTDYDGWREWGGTWWVPVEPKFRKMGPHERLAWLEGDSDIITGNDLIEVTEPGTDRQWLVLSGFSKWSGYGLRDGRKELQRDTWFRLTCILVHRQEQDRTVEGLRNRILTDPNTFPAIEVSGRYFYLGEYPWDSEVQGLDKWTSEEDRWNFVGPVRATVGTYTVERGGYDYSIDQTVRVEMPAPWLAKSMGLRLKDGRRPVFVDTHGQNLFYDPSLVGPGPAAALVDRDAFLRTLKQQGLAAVWVIAGEKGAYGGTSGIPAFGGRLLHTAVHYHSGSGFEHYCHTERQDPTEEQRKEFFAGDVAPSGISSRTGSGRSE